jgi:diguanylate cyclase (GGDEF)-like protein
MKPDVVRDIIALCLCIDLKARRFYDRLSSSYAGEELGLFWKQMSQEEEEHVRFWKELARLAKRGMVPQIFDRPFQVRNELRRIKDVVGLLQQEHPRSLTTNDALLLTYRLEFHVLHPAIESLFQLAKNLEYIVGIKTPDYETHINGLIHALDRHKKLSPELELLGEALRRIWIDTKQLATQANTDGLTNVLNRRGFFQVVRPFLHLAKRNNHHVGVMMIDIDHFKRINDIYGHQMGDQVLRSVARVIKSALRASDVLGRYGGEEFIVFMPLTDPSGLVSFGERIRQAVEREEQEDITVTISIGVSHGFISDEVNRDLNELIGKADRLMYKAKAGGRNKVVVDG